MTLGSLFDGIGGFPLSASRLGIIPVWASEIDKNCISITKRHFPEMKHYGDITKINGGDIEPVDIITFGSPCQDLSTAGKRKGLSGERSGLFMEAVRIIKEMREKTNGTYPRRIIWENVPGAFSSNEGEDFRAVLEEIANIASKERVTIPRPPARDDSGNAIWEGAGCVMGDNWSLAWRILDAQYWGVPQRRKRIFLVADFRGRCAAEILFEPYSVSRDIEESEETREGTAADAGKRSEAAGFNGWHSVTGTIEYEEEKAPCLQSTMPPDVMLYENHANDSRITECKDGVAPTVTQRFGTGGGNVTLVMEDTTIGCDAEFNCLKDKMGVLKATNTNAIAIEGNGARPSHKGSGYSEDDVSFTLNATERHAVAYTSSSYAKYKEGGGTLKASGGDAGGGSETLINTGYTVRRLLPIEAERLMVFPDNYTACGHDNKKISDSARYKALGNSVAIPCVDFLMSRIKEGLAE